MVLATVWRPRIALVSSGLCMTTFSSAEPQIALASHDRILAIFGSDA